MDPADLWSGGIIIPGSLSGLLQSMHFPLIYTCPGVAAIRK